MKTNQHISVFRLRDLIKPDLRLWLLSWLLGLATAVSVVGLLMVSGWYLTATALLAGVASTPALASITTSSVSLYQYSASVWIRIFAVTRTLGRYAELVMAHDAIFSLLRDLRVRFFQALANQPLNSQHDSLQSSQKMHRLVSDINALNEFNLRIVLPWLTAIVVVLLMAGLLVVADVNFALFSPSPTSYSSSIYLLIGLLLVCLLIPTVMAYKGVAYNRKIASIAEQRRARLLAPLTIIPQLLMWQQWHKQTQDFINDDNRLQALQWQAEKQKSITLLVVQWLIYAGVILLLYSTAGSHVNSSADADILVLPCILAILFALFGLQEVLLPLAQHYLSYGKAHIAKERLNAMLDPMLNPKLDSTPPAYNSNTNTGSLIKLPTDTPIMQLTNVCAKMPTAIVGAENVSCTVRAGVPMIISGASGCGKSTLLQTLANELLPQSGEVLLNGQAWHSYDWADQLGYLGQQLDIFDQTLADNLRLGKADASDAELLAVLDKVALLDWVQAQPQGLQTQLGEYGTAVSGGQARRIALARLLLKPRLLLLLDEPFAGLDKSAQSKLWHAVTQHQQHALLIVVSHHQQWQGIGAVDRLRL